MNINFLFLSAANFFYFFGLGVFNLFPLYLGKLGAQKFYIGFLMGLPVLVNFFYSFKIRNKIDFVNKKHYFLFAALLSCFIYFLYYLFPNLYVIPFIRIFQGIINGIGVIFGLSIVVDIVAPEKKTSYLAIFGIMGSVANVFSPYLAEVLIRHIREPKTIFLVSVGASLLWVIFTLLVKYQPQEKEPNTGAQKVRTMDYIKIIPLAIMNGGVFAAIFNFISHYTYELRIAVIAIFFQVQTVVMIIIRIFFYNKFDKWDRKRTIVTCFSISALALFVSFLLKYNQSWAVLAFIGFLYGIVQGILFPTLNSLFIDTTPNRSGKANIIFISSRNLGIVIFSFSCGLLSQFFGYSMMYLILSLLSFAFIIYVVKKKGIQY